MKSQDIRTHGIEAPGEAHGGDAVAENLALLVGIGREIAAQLAEMNERLEANGYKLAGIVLPKKELCSNCQHQGCNGECRIKVEV